MSSKYSANLYSEIKCFRIIAKISMRDTPCTAPPTHITYRADSAARMLNGKWEKSIPHPRTRNMMSMDENRMGNKGIIFLLD